MFTALAQHPAVESMSNVSAEQRDKSNQAIAFMPGRLQGLEGFNWGKYLRKKTWVLNDGVAALVAECKRGAAKGKKNVVMITLGTGVGGAILIDGKPY